MSNEDVRMALVEWSREDLVESWIGLNTLLEASAVRREAAETRCAQLEEEARQQEEFYGNRMGILESRNLKLEREAEWSYQAGDRIAELEEALQRIEAFASERLSWARRKHTQWILERILNATGAALSPSKEED